MESELFLRDHRTSLIFFGESSRLQGLASVTARIRSVEHKLSRLFSFPVYQPPLCVSPSTAYPFSTVEHVSSTSK